MLRVWSGLYETPHPSLGGKVLDGLKHSTANSAKEGPKSGVLIMAHYETEGPKRLQKVCVKGYRYRASYILTLNYNIVTHTMG